MLFLHPLHPSGPDILLVCGCKGTTFPDTIPRTPLSRINLNYNMNNHKCCRKRYH